MVQTAKHTEAVYAGSFDPVTYGHLDIIFQAAAMMDTLHVVVACNSSKSPIFTPQERADMVRDEINSIVIPRLAQAGHNHNIQVHTHGGLMAAFMKANNAPYFVRGLRLGTEFDKEYPSIIVNRNEYPVFTPVFLCSTDPALQVVSSSIAREVAAFSGSSLHKYVSPAVEKQLVDRMNKLGLIKP